MMSKSSLRSNQTPQSPLKIIEASLELNEIRNGTTLYFNYDNSLKYLKSKRDYYNYIQIPKETVIDEVTVLTDPVVYTYTDNSNPMFSIGGARDLNSPVTVLYAAANQGTYFRPQYQGEILSTSQLNSNPINYFGHSAAKFPYNQNNNGNPDSFDQYKFLALTIYDPLFPDRQPIVQSGVLHLLLKTYPK